MRRTCFCSDSLWTRLKAAEPGTVRGGITNTSLKPERRWTSSSPITSAGNEPGVFAPLRDVLLTHGDFSYMHLADLPSYCEAQDRLGALYANPGEWSHKAILNIASSGEVFKRPDHRRIRKRYLEGETMSSSVRAQPGARETVVSLLAGKPAPRNMLIDVARLEWEYFESPPRCG